DEFILRCDNVLAKGASVEEAQAGRVVVIRLGALSAVIMTHDRAGARITRTSHNHVGFEWHAPMTTGVEQCLRVRVVVSKESLDVDAEWRTFTEQQRPDIARLRRDAVATVQMVTMT
ncbi:MAG: hypothetical protein HOH74_10455, partial [Gemmatimonadetes bacterium]|nr:hypothetical protein [Gemmatimonadota bacterium]